MDWMIRFVNPIAKIKLFCFNGFAQTELDSAMYTDMKKICEISYDECMGNCLPKNLFPSIFIFP